MTVAHYDEEITSESHPLDMLERCVEDNGWPFERSGRDELNLSVAGRWCDHHFCFTWREDLQSLHLSSAFDMRVDDSRRADIAALLMYINAKLWIGHFDLWSGEDIVMFRHSLVLAGGAHPNDAQCGTIVHEALKACENYYQAFQFVLWAGRSAREALELAMFETQGSA